MLILCYIPRHALFLLGISRIGESIGGGLIVAQCPHGVADAMDHRDRFVSFNLRSRSVKSSRYVPNNILPLIRQYSVSGWLKLMFMKLKGLRRREYSTYVFPCSVE